MSDVVVFMQARAGKGTHLETISFGWDAGVTREEFIERGEELLSELADRLTFPPAPQSEPPRETQAERELRLLREAQEAMSRA